MPEDIIFKVTLRHSCGANVCRCNGKVASCTGNEEVGVARAAEKAINDFAALNKNPAVLTWPTEVKRLGGDVWAVTYKAPKP